MCWEDTLEPLTLPPPALSLSVPLPYPFDVKFDSPFAAQKEAWKASFGMQQGTAASSPPPTISPTLHRLASAIKKAVEDPRDAIIRETFAVLGELLVDDRLADEMCLYFLKSSAFDAAYLKYVKIQGDLEKRDVAAAAAARQRAAVTPPPSPASVPLYATAQSIWSAAHVAAPARAAFPAFQPAAPRLPLTARPVTAPHNSKF